MKFLLIVVVILSIIEILLSFFGIKQSYDWDVEYMPKSNYRFSCITIIILSMCNIIFGILYLINGKF